MNTTRIDYLRKELDNERISTSELLEIDALAKELNINITNDMLASDILNAVDAFINVIPL